MDKLLEFMNQLVGTRSLKKAVFSNQRVKDVTKHSKITIQPILLKKDIHYQFTYQINQKVHHENIMESNAASRMAESLRLDFKQGLFHTTNSEVQILMGKTNDVRIIEKKLKQPTSSVEIPLTHNRQKRYILEEGTPVAFLVELGVMNSQGKVLAAKYDKFRQINRYLEMVQDVLPYLNIERKLNIVDFGCGKSYLTFALYYYLTSVKQLQLQMTGLDLKSDVIRYCNELALTLQYDNLKFLEGDISSYNELQKVDMVVTLHACDTATDDAIEKAVRWNADVILTVPCCQHELFRQITNNDLAPMLNHGIIKERFAALATDSARALILELVGYKTQILEFIDLEHTPKNLLIRAVKPKEIDNRTVNEHTNRMDKHVQDYLGFTSTLNILPFLEHALRDKLSPLLDPYKNKN